MINSKQEEKQIIAPPEKVQLFEGYVKYFQTQLGIFNYKIYVKPKKMESRGQLSADIKGKIASIFYDPEWLTEASNEDMRTTAFHEVMELSLYELRLMALYTYSENKVAKVVHEIIRRAENTFYKYFKL